MKRSLGAQTLLYPTPVLVIGTYSQDGKPNAMTVAWGGICSSDPPSVAISVRPARLTYENIRARKAFTVNIPSVTYANEADFFGVAPGRNKDKFAATGLIPVKSELVDAPYIQEFPLILECSLLHTFDLGAHTQFVGEILDVKAEDKVLNHQGHPDVALVNPFVYCPDNNMNYHSIGKIIGRSFSMGQSIK
ncbi:flavin reductase family protein [bacterium]|nr:flavin reductase family protein [bacterium]